MALPKSLQQPIRQGNLSVGSGWRGYFAPYNQQQAVATANTSIGPTMYDLQVTGRYIDGTTLPGTWFDLGYVKNFKFTPGSKTGNVMTGYRGAIRAKYRAETSEKLSVLFMEMTRTALRLASGTQVFNLLKTTAAASTVGPLSATGSPAIAMGASGYLPTGGPSGPTLGLPTLCVPAGSGAAFPAGTYIVVDQDYASQQGYVGDAGANVFPGAVSNVDFIRMTSDYVACVSQVVLTAFSGQDALILTAPFMGGGNSLPNVTPNTAPTAGAKVQAISGYVTREGGTYIAEWSALFLLNTIDASQVMFYYPRLAPDQFQGSTEENLQNATSLQTTGLNASFDSLAFDDPLDGETVVAYRAYYPHPSQTLQV